LDALHNSHGLTRPVSTLSQFKLKSGMVEELAATSGKVEIQTAGELIQAMIPVE
jgi:hypothetical protein